MKSLFRSSFLLVFFFVFISGSRAQTPHPLDPLTYQEYWKVLESLRKAGHMNDSTGFSMINLIEPEKQTVWNWEPGQVLSRQAYATVHHNGKFYRAEVDLTNEKELAFKELKGIQATWLGSEFSAMIGKVLEHPDFIKGLEARGYDDFSFLDCFIGPRANFGEEQYQGKRVGICNCTDPRYVRNTWGREIDGLSALVDLNTGEVLTVVDEGAVPMATVNSDFDNITTKDQREVPGPFVVTQPNGPGFTVDGYVIEWQKWKFHVRPDHRVGLIISTVTYQDGDEERKIMYQGNLSEIFVPYMDDSYGWFARNFIDAGEYTAGGLIKPMFPGQDAPAYAHYIDGLFSDDSGRPLPVANLVAIFERATGDPAWRHNGDAANESRVKRDLVVRAAAVLGNYDYLFDWVFQQDGSIRVLAGATGIAEAKVVAQKDASSPSDGEPDDQYGRFVDPHIVAVNHDHYFSYRIDLDVDGPVNQIELSRLQRKMLPEGHPRRSVWVNNPKIAEKESDVKLNIDLNKPTLWRVLSTTKKNAVGYPTSYQLMPGKTANTLLSEDDYPRLRVGFINHHLWATPYAPTELFAAGDYPTLSTPGMGLPAWTSANRDINNKDIVLWYTIGMHHMVRAEDWPVMPVLWHSFEIRPFDFFDHNPAIDLPE